MKLRNGSVDVNHYWTPNWSDIPHRDIAQVAVQLMPYYLWQTPSLNWVLVNSCMMPPGIPGRMSGPPYYENHPKAVRVNHIDMEDLVKDLAYDGEYTLSGYDKTILLLQSPFELFEAQSLKRYEDAAYLLKGIGLTYLDGSKADPFCIRFNDTQTFDIQDLYALVDGGKA